MEKAARRADDLGRGGLAQLLRQEIADYQEAKDATGESYQTVRVWLADEPDLTLPQVKRSLADCLCPRSRPPSGESRRCIGQRDRKPWKRGP
jgi:hypothetical protein